MTETASSALTEEAESITRLLAEVKENAVLAAAAELRLLEAEARLRTKSIERAAFALAAGAVVGLAAVSVLAFALVVFVAGLLEGNSSLAALVVGTGLALVTGVLFVVARASFRKATGARRGLRSSHG